MSEYTISNPPFEKDFKGVKESEGKVFYELDFEFITQMAERITQNKGKYEKWNWKKPIDIESLKQALFRHTLAIMNGDVNEDHLAAVAVNAMIINYQQKLEIKESFK